MIYNKKTLLLNIKTIILKTLENDSKMSRILRILIKRMNCSKAYTIGNSKMSIILRILDLMKYTDK